MTTKPSTELAANNALNEISAIAKSRKPLDKFTHDRLEREVRSSISIDAAFSYATLGALEAISGNEELMEQYHLNAIKLRGNSLMHANYAGSLHHVMRLTEAAEQARIAATLDPADIEALTKAINYTVQSGGITLAATLVNSYKRLNLKNPENFEYILTSALFQQKAGIYDEEVIRLIEICCEFLRSNKIWFTQQNLEIDDEKEGGFLSFCISLDRTNEEIWNFNRKLFDVMLDRLPDQSPSLSVRFESLRAA